MGLLKTPEEEDFLDLNDENPKDTSPFKDLMATLEKPADLTAHPGTPVSLFQHHNVISPPRSADYCSKKTTFFQVSYLVKCGESAARVRRECSEHAAHPGTPVSLFENDYLPNK